MYGPQSYTGRKYDGLGVTGRFGSDWELQYDVYGGEISGVISYPGVMANDPATVLEGLIYDRFETPNAIGGRVNIVTPVEGLFFGASGYHGEDDQETDVWGAHLEYVADPWLVRVETGHLRKIQYDSNDNYIELAFKVTPKLQLAARYDTWESNAELNPATPDFVYQMLKHDELAFGVNYWFSPQFVLKANVALVDGNRFAYPRDPDTILNVAASRPRRTVVMKAMVSRLTLVSLLLVPVQLSAEDSVALQVIVNSANPVSSLSKGRLAGLFLKKTTKWDTGQAAQPVDQVPDSALRQGFSRDVLGKDVSAVRSYWQKQIFSGRATPPVELPSSQEVLRFVQSNPNAIGYVTEGTRVGNGAKTVKVTD